MKKSLRCIANAGETLRKLIIEGKYYINEKYVKSACGIADFGVLKAIDNALIDKNGYTKDKLLKKIEEYGKAIKKNFAVFSNGKLLR